MSDDIIRMARKEAENWRSRYELISLEVSFWRKQHDMLLKAMADSALTAPPPMMLADKESYELGRLHGAGEEREACAKACETHTVDDVLVGVGIAQSCADAIRARGQA